MNRSIEATGTVARHKVAGWVPPMARLGYAAKGVVYALIGGIAIKAAATSGGAEGHVGALASLTDESGGRLALLVIAIGLLCHVSWRLVQALVDPEHPRTDARRVGMRLFYLFSALAYGSMAFTAWQLGQGGRAERDGHEVWIARLLQQPFGTWLVMLAGLGVMAYGVHQLIKAFRGDVNKRIEPRGADTVRGVALVGRIGTGARGFVLLPIGWFVFNAGRYFRASEAADTGEVLKMLGHGWLLGAVGAGLLAYGLHQFAKAMYRRIDRPA